MLFKLLNRCANQVKTMIYPMMQILKKANVGLIMIVNLSHLKRLLQSQLSGVSKWIGSFMVLTNLSNITLKPREMCQKHKDLKFFSRLWKSQRCCLKTGVLIWLLRKKLKRVGRIKLKLKKCRTVQRKFQLSTRSEKS